MNQMIFNKMRTEGELILDEEMLEMPIKKSKELQNLIKLKVEEKKLIDQVSSRFRQMKNSDSRTLPMPKQQLTTNHNHIKAINNSNTKSTKAISSVQKELKMNQSNSEYLATCVIRALRYRKLAIDDVADIFGISSETVQEIDKFRRIQQLEEDSMTGGSSNCHKADKIEKKDTQMKMKSFKNYNLGMDGFSSMSFSQLARKPFNNHSQFYDPRQTTMRNPRHHTLSSYQLSSIMDSAQQRQHQDDNLFQYQKLLRSKPPHRLDDKVKAIIEIVKKHPNIMQKQIIKILAKDYNITNMTQTSISRYYKKIYQMRKHCQVLLLAKKDGFIDI